MNDFTPITDCGNDLITQAMFIEDDLGMGPLFYTYGIPGHMTIIHLVGIEAQLSNIEINDDNE